MNVRAHTLLDEEEIDAIASATAVLAQGPLLRACQRASADAIREALLLHTQRVAAMSEQSAAAANSCCVTLRLAAAEQIYLGLLGSPIESVLLGLVQLLVDGVRRPDSLERRWLVQLPQAFDLEQRLAQAVAAGLLEVSADGQFVPKGQGARAPERG